MILTLTPNPTLDRAIFVRNFRLGTVVRGEREVAVPSGKGVGSSLVIHELGGETVATGLNAGYTGRLLADLLDEMGVAYDFVLADGETRTCIVLVDLAVRQQSTISAPTLRATRSHLAQLLAMVERHAPRAWGLICAGSLPPGLPPDAYAQLLGHARRLGLFTLLDTSGEALRRGVTGLPHILRVNHHELQALGILGHRSGPASKETGPGRGFGAPRVPGNAAGLAEKLRPRLGQWASDALIVTLGDEGALAVTPEADYHARPPAVPVLNTAGAGDALNGGVMLALSRGEGWPAALALGTAAAALVVMTEGTAICRREQVEKLLPHVRVARGGTPGSVTDLER